MLVSGSEFRYLRASERFEDRKTAFFFTRLCRKVALCLEAPSSRIRLCLAGDKCGLDAAMIRIFKETDACARLGTFRRNITSNFSSDGSFRDIY